jgi:hypothetical protein
MFKFLTKALLTDVIIAQFWFHMLHTNTVVGDNFRSDHLLVPSTVY